MAAGVLLTEIVKLVVGGAIRAEAAQTGGKTGRLSTLIAQRAEAQVAAGTAIPIPPDALAAFIAGGSGVVTGRARQFAFIGQGSTLTIAQFVALGLIESAGSPVRTSPGFTLQVDPRSVPLGQLVGRGPGGPSLSERLRLRNGTIRWPTLNRRPDWGEFPGSRATA